MAGLAGAEPSKRVGVVTRTGYCGEDISASCVPEWQTTLPWEDATT